MTFFSGENRLGFVLVIFDGTCVKVKDVLVVLYFFFLFLQKTYTFRRILEKPNS